MARAHDKAAFVELSHFPNLSRLFRSADGEVNDVGCFLDHITQAGNFSIRRLHRRRVRFGLFGKLFFKLRHSWPQHFIRVGVCLSKKLFQFSYPFGVGNQIKPRLC